MIYWLLGGGYVAAMVITGVVIATLNVIDLYDMVDPSDSVFWSFWIGCIFWPLTVIGYAAYGTVLLLAMLRDRRQDRLLRKQLNGVVERAGQTGLRAAEVRHLQITPRPED